MSNSKEGEPSSQLIHQLNEPKRENYPVKPDPPWVDEVIAEYEELIERESKPWPEELLRAAPGLDQIMFITPVEWDTATPKQRRQLIKTARWAVSMAKRRGNVN
jgi:hypothetical protein